MDEIEDKTRVDKWLWAARFYKTRSLAAEAIAGGKVQVNGERAKRARPLQVGDEIRIRQGPYEHHVVVRALAGRRGPAARAAAAVRGDSAEPGRARGDGAAAQESPRGVRAGEGPADEEGPAGDRAVERTWAVDSDASHVLHHRLAELAGLEQRGAGHQPLEVVGHPLLADGLLQRAR